MTKKRNTSILSLLPFVILIVAYGINVQCKQKEYNLNKMIGPSWSFLTNQDLRSRFVMRIWGVTFYTNKPERRVRRVADYNDMVVVPETEQNSTQKVRHDSMTSASFLENSVPNVTIGEMDRHDSMTSASFLENSVSNVTNGSDNVTGNSTEAPPAPNPRSAYVLNVVNKICLYSYAIFWIVGTTLNVFTVLTMIRPNLRKVSSSTYFICLAFADTCVLWIEPQKRWLGQVVDTEGYGLLPYCKFVVFMNTTFTSYSAWLIVAVTFERFVAVYFPLHVKSLLTVKSARIISFALFVAAVGCYCPVFAGVRDIVGTTQCGPEEGYEFYYGSVVPYMYITTYLFIPSISLVTLNFLIILRLRRQTIKFKKEMEGSKDQVKSREDDFQRIAYTVVSISVSFMILITPMVVLQIYILSVSSRMGELGDNFILDLFLTEAAANVLVFLNHSANFVIYVCSSQRFRTEFFDLMTCGRYSAKQLARKQSQRTLNSILSSTENNTVKT